jgi:peroxiredoxin
LRKKDREWGRLEMRWRKGAVFFTALIGASLLGAMNAEWTWEQSQASQSLQSFSKPLRLPEFSLENLEGKMVDIRDYKGRVILLNFWATWWPDCRKEGPSLEKLYTQYKSKGLILFRIDTKESRETVIKFLEKEPLKLPVLLDKTGKVGRLFGLWVHPTSYLINREGMVCYRSMGVLDWPGPEATSVIDLLLKER